MTDMNIFFIGPGNNPKRLGRYFSNRADTDNHNIKYMSHKSKLNHIDTIDHVYCSFNLQEEIVFKFEKLMQDWQHIDLLFYNSTGGWYPENKDHYTSKTVVDDKQWHIGLDIHAVVPHILTCKALNFMNENSKIIYMTSSASYLITRDNYLDRAGYFGLKGAQNQLMRSFAAYNDKKATVTTFAPHIPYDESEELSATIMDAIYDRAINLKKEDNGRIIQFYPPKGIPQYYE